MPSRLRPTGSFAADAILVGDPGRALLLAQELLDQPKMSNHARGLWGYSGNLADCCELDPAIAGSKPRPGPGMGRALTIQSTGMGGPSAALVLGDLAELGVRRALRVGTCVGVGEATQLGELLVVTEAVAVGGSAAAHGVGAHQAVAPDEGLTARLTTELGENGRAATIASVDAHPGHQPAPADVVAADMQTAPLLACARSLGIEVAALLIVAESATGAQLERQALEEAEKRAGHVAVAVVSA